MFVRLARFVVFLEKHQFPRAKRVTQFVPKDFFSIVLCNSSLAYR
jgi:hypothetical protein